MQSYCSSFHNDLSTDEKSNQFNKAKADLLKFLKVNYNKPIPSIQRGLEIPISDNAWRIIEEVFLNRHFASALF